MQELLTSGDVAELEGVTRQTVNNWVAWGWLKPTHELPTGRLFTMAEVEAYRRLRDQATA